MVYKYIGVNKYHTNSLFNLLDQPFLILRSYFIPISLESVHKPAVAFIISLFIFTISTLLPSMANITLSFSFKSFISLTSLGKVTCQFLVILDIPILLIFNSNFYYINLTIYLNFLNIL